MQIESTDKNFLKLYMGPNPGDEMFKITSLNIFLAESITELTYSLLSGVYIQVHRLKK